MQHGRPNTTLKRRRNDDTTDDDFRRVSTSDQLRHSTVAELIEEVSGLKATLRENQDQISSMQHQMNLLKDAVQKLQAQPTIDQVKELRMRTLNGEQARFMATIRFESPEEESDSDEPPAYQTQPPAPPLTLRQILANRMSTFPDYRGYPVQRDQLKPISFMKLRDCISLGWERNFKEALDNLYTPKSKRDTREFLYLRGRVVFVTPQHAIVIEIKTQKSSEHGFRFVSPFDDVYGEEREFFFDTITTGNREWDPKVYYAGTYRIVSLKDLHPEGVPYEEKFYQRDMFDVPADRIINTVLESQIQRPSLRKQDATHLVKSGIIKLEFVGLQCVGFNDELYRSVTASPPAPTPVRNSDGSAGGSGKKQKTRSKLANKIPTVLGGICTVFSVVFRTGSPGSTALTVLSGLFTILSPFVKWYSLVQTILRYVGGQIVTVTVPLYDVELGVMENHKQQYRPFRMKPRPKVEIVLPKRANSGINIQSQIPGSSAHLSLSQGNHPAEPLLPSSITSISTSATPSPSFPPDPPGAYDKEGGGYTNHGGAHSDLGHVESTRPSLSEPDMALEASSTTHDAGHEEQRGDISQFNSDSGGRKGSQDSTDQTSSKGRETPIEDSKKATNLVYSYARKIVDEKSRLKAEVISLNWVLRCQDGLRKRTRENANLCRVFDMAFQPDPHPQNPYGRYKPGARLWDMVHRMYLPDQTVRTYFEMPASSHCNLYKMHIIVSANPEWHTTLERKRGIRCIDVFRAVYDMLQKPLTRRELSMIPHRSIRFCEDAQGARIKNSPVPEEVERSRGILRIDSFVNYRFFKGLTQKDDVWMLETCSPDGRPFPQPLPPA
ncbi:hypothetical protein Moror_16745 [Moniliophthora roreri MCA 2997]|uniref:DUF6699 domain-containing protein n=1 Tax=Moniliophthora roreri (strain MCA 2997) TaxID=1381753 RepID=V2WMJ4_MONRO|nr:hypothetical protein Moror_16745 [Moniliophthora roreri MCA 2997]